MLECAAAATAKVARRYAVAFCLIGVARSATTHVSVIIPIAGSAATYISVIISIAGSAAMVVAER